MSNNPDEEFLNATDLADKLIRSQNVINFWEFTETEWNSLDPNQQKKFTDLYNYLHNPETKQLILSRSKKGGRKRRKTKKKKKKRKKKKKTRKYILKKKRTKRRY